MLSFHFRAGFNDGFCQVVEYFSFKDQLQEMQRNYPSWNHTVFRVNDQRRYSMFYHRCMSYRLMLRYEKEHNTSFDWVVLVRLVSSQPLESFYCCP